MSTLALDLDSRQAGGFRADSTIVRFVSGELAPPHRRGRGARALGCNANQEVNPSSQTASQIFAGHYEETNPYNPISYAQNNTGRGGGR